MIGKHLVILKLYDPNLKQRH